MFIQDAFEWSELSVPRQIFVLRNYAPDYGAYYDVIIKVHAKNIAFVNSINVSVLQIMSCVQAPVSCASFIDIFFHDRFAFLKETERKRKILEDERNTVAQWIGTIVL